MTRDNGWEASADAWVAALGPDGDFARLHVLDAPMLARVDAAPRTRALDVGCGEGRFCRKLTARGIAATGVDTGQRLIAEARRRDPAGRYIIGDACALPLPAHSVDLVVSYLALIDIDDAETAIAEMARVLAPGGTLLLANLNSIATANPHHGWIEADGEKIFPIDHYLTPRREWVGWKSIRIANWHRPLCAYMHAFLAAGLTLTHFDEPEPESASELAGGDAERAARYRRVPWFVLMEWQKPLLAA
ncbi:MAG: class I SAM-dependent methyltransferase [Pseudomonadota bacterium]